MLAILVALSTFLGLLSTPSTLAHEATHRWFARRAGVVEDELVVDPLGVGAVYRCEFREASSRLLVALAFVAPTVVGLLLGAVVVGWFVAAGGSTPETMVGWARLTVALGAWAIYVAPSAADGRGAINA